MGAHSGHQHHGHDGGDGDQGDIDWDAMAAHLEQEAELSAPFVAEAVTWLRGMLPGGVGRLLDVGCGPGVHTCQFARAFPDAEVIAVDGESGLLERVRDRAVREGVHGRVRTREAQLPDELGDLGTADVIWTSRVVHHLGDQQAALDTLARSVRPGGLLVVVERGLAPRYLPRDIGIGRPGLLARLEALNEDWFTGMRDALPGRTETVEDWPAMLARAGLAPATRSFLTDLPAPLDTRARSHLHARLARYRDTLADTLDTDDVLVLDALLDEDAPTGILHRPDAFYLTATTVHAGARRN